MRRRPAARARSRVVAAGIAGSRRSAAIALAPLGMLAALPSCCSWSSLAMLAARDTRRAAEPLLSVVPLGMLAALPSCCCSLTPALSRCLPRPLSVGHRPADRCRAAPRAAAVALLPSRVRFRHTCDRRTMIKVEYQGLGE
jgi:hypothetical protein